MDWKERYVPTPREAILEGIVVLVTTGAFVGWAWSQLDSNRGPWIFLGALATVAVTLWGIAQFNAIYRSGPHNRRDGEWATLLREWLHNEGLSVGGAMRLPAGHIHLEAKDLGGRVINFNKIPNENRLQLSATIVPSGTFDDLSKLHETAQRRVLARMRIEISQAGIGFNGIAPPLRAITLDDFVVLDHTLNERNFIQAVKRFTRGIVILRQSLALGLAIELGDELFGDIVDAPTATPPPEGGVYAQ